MALAEQYVQEDQPERVDIGALIGRLASGLFRRHVLHGAENRSDHRLGRCGLQRNRGPRWGAS